MAGQKRKTPTAGGHPDPKRPRNSKLLDSSTNDAAYAPTDLTTGQRSAFPGLDASGDGEDGEALFYGPAEDGLEYLRMVREEARGVPNLLTAPATEHETLYSDYCNQGGWYGDGAFISMPLHASNLLPQQRHGRHSKKAEDGDEEQDVQEKYYTALLSRFRDLRSLLRSPAPQTAGSGGDGGRGNDPLEWENLSQRQWRARLLYSRPTPALLATLSQDAVMEGLSAVEKFMGWRFLSGGALADGREGGLSGTTSGAVGMKGKGEGGYVAAWTWVFLARCRDVGEMGSEDVGVLRGVGKRAGGMVRELAAGLVEEEGEGDGKVEDGGKGEDEEEEEWEDSAEEEGQGEDREEGMGEEQGFNDYDADDALATGEVNETNGREQTTNPLPTPNAPLPEPQIPGNDTDSIHRAKSRLLSSLNQQPTLEPSSSKSHTSQNPMLSPRHDLPPKNPLSPASPPPAVNTKENMTARAANAATLDMILTIVGEVFGQRDLLASRRVWD